MALKAKTPQSFCSKVWETGLFSWGFEGARKKESTLTDIRKASGGNYGGIGGSASWDFFLVGKLRLSLENCQISNIPKTHPKQI